MIISLPSDIFSGLVNLQELDINAVEVGTFSKDLFSDLINLKTLVFNPPSVIPKGLLSPLVNLKELFIKGRSETLPEGIFTGLPKLQSLSINRELKELPSGVFKDLEKLKILDLSNNSFDWLSGEVFTGLHSLERLYIGIYPLKNLPVTLMDLPKLKDINCLRFGPGESPENWGSLPEEFKEFLVKMTNRPLFC